MKVVIPKQRHVVQESDRVNKLELRAENAWDEETLTNLYRLYAVLREGQYVRTRDGWYGEIVRIWAWTNQPITVESDWPDDGKRRKSRTRRKDYSPIDVWPIVGDPR